MTSIGKVETKTDTESSKTKDDVNEALYSRQLYTLGRDAQRKLMKANVLIYGLGGAGIEIAKNVTLTGLNKVVLIDETVCQFVDQGSNFFITNEDVKNGVTRANACKPHLQELNRYVDIEVESQLTKEILLQHEIRCVVVDGQLMSYTDRFALNELCRSMNIKFLTFESRGLFAAVFADFGPKHIITDPDGKNPTYRDVQIITNEEEGVVTILDDNDPHNLGDGDYVTFEGLKGCDGLNGCEPRKVKVVNARSFSIGDTRNVGTYDITGGGGYVKQVKVPKEVEYKSMKEVYANPDQYILHSDFAKWNNPSLLHKAYETLDTFRLSNGGALPSSSDMSSVEQFVQLVASKVDGGKLNPTDERLIKAFAMGAKVELNPMAAVVGGLVGQEVSKAVTNKFTPLNQLFYLDAIECLPEESWPLSAEEYQLSNTRYDAQTAVFGKTFVDKIREATMFIVGSGAIGCEMMKNWALMGLGTSPKVESKIHVTDMDIIEMSNLSRQFLFRTPDIGKFKSECAAKAAKKMNPDLRMSVYQEKVSPESENFFNDDFYNSLTGVCTALDNIQARLYVDQRCVEFGKAMFESGTEGVMGNTQVVIPHVTAEYGAYRDAVKKTTPICTLKHFPHRIEHTIQYARSEFEGLFTNGPQDANSYLKEGTTFINSLEPNVRGTVIKNIRKALDDERPLTFDQCIVWARLKYEEIFTNSIKQLLYNFPPGYITDKGVPFWSGKKRTPTPSVFDADDEMSFTFIQAASILRAENYNLKRTSDWEDKEYYKSVLEKTIVPEFTPCREKIATTEAEAKKMDEEKENQEAEAMDVSTLPDPSSLAGFKLTAADFEKDDDTNFHMAFVTSYSNLRARAYQIPEADMFRTKQIAGNIIPAIATTTALVTGFVCLEMYKYLRGENRIEQYKSQQCNLALPMFNPMEPAPADKVVSRLKGEDYTYTIWDSLVIPGNVSELKLKDFLAYFENELKLEVSMVSYGTSLIYFSLTSSKARLEMSMKEVIELVSKQELPDAANSKYIKLDCCVEEEDNDDELDFPGVKILNA